ncbi:MAG: L,D-transpeptidase family protein, partial [Pseudomonadota bacterium]
ALAAGCAPKPVAGPIASTPDVVAQAAEAAPAGAVESTAQAMTLRDVPPGVPLKGKAILVNIPSYELIAYEDGVPVLRSRVIVGKNVRGDRTPVMETEVSVVRFRPTWRPTPSMIRSGKYVDGVRPAGPRNPLGLLAIRLEPGMLIYLHGTNKPHLFERDRRALSAGCVRVEKWDEVAAWVLDATLEEVHASANGRRTFDQPPERRVKVLMRYHTRFPDENGVMRTHADIYGRGGEPFRMASVPVAPVLPAAATQ